MNYRIFHVYMKSIFKKLFCTSFVIEKEVYVGTTCKKEDRSSFSSFFSMCQFKRRWFKEDQLELAGVTKVGTYGALSLRLLLAKLTYTHLRIHTIPAVHSKCSHRREHISSSRLYFSSKVPAISGSQRTKWNTHFLNVSPPCGYTPGVVC